MMPNWYLLDLIRTGMIVTCACLPKIFGNGAEFYIRLVFIITFYLVAKLCRRGLHSLSITGSHQNLSKE